MPHTFSQKYNLYTGEKFNWLQLIFLLGKSIFAGILFWVVFFASYSFILTLIYYTWKPDILVSKDDNFIGTVLLIFNIGLPSLLVYRTNTANERFWEARKLWGELVNVARNLTRDICIVIQDEHPKNRKEKESILLLVVAFAICCKLHLRGEQINNELTSLISRDQYYKLKHHSDHPPLQIAFWIGDYLQSRYDNDYLHVYQLVGLNNLVNALIDILGGCERILKTPQPIIYGLMLRKLVIIYCLLLPFEIINDCHGFTILVVTFASIVLFGIEQIGAQLEQPFALNPNALPLDLICNTILLNVKELIKQTSRGNYKNLP